MFRVRRSLGLGATGAHDELVYVRWYEGKKTKAPGGRSRSQPERIGRLREIAIDGRETGWDEVVADLDPRAILQFRSERDSHIVSSPWSSCRLPPGWVT